MYHRSVHQRSIGSIAIIAIMALCLLEDKTSDLLPNRDVEIAPGGLRIIISMSSVAPHLVFRVEVDWQESASDVSGSIKIPYW